MGKPVAIGVEINRRHPLRRERLRRLDTVERDGADGQGVVRGGVAEYRRSALELRGGVVVKANPFQRVGAGPATD